MEVKTEEHPPPPAQPAKKERHIGLDVLRGVAILLVLGRHNPAALKDGGLFQPFSLYWVQFGWTGVDLFFVLSGFLIGGLLFQEFKRNGKLDLKRFYVRRLFKIWPTYYLAIGLSFLLVLVRTKGDFGQSFGIMWPNLIHIQNYIPDDRRPLGQSWSLAVEEHFYLLLPLLLAFLWPRFVLVKSFKPKKIVWIFLGLIAICASYRVYISFAYPFEPYTQVFPTHLRIDSLLFGVLLGYALHYMPHVMQTFDKNRITFIVFGLALISPMFFMSIDLNPSAFIPAFGFILLYLGYACLLMTTVMAPHFSTEKAKKNPILRLLAFIGFHSYPIYLWHTFFSAKPVEFMMHRSLFTSDHNVAWFLGTGTYVFLSVVTGAIMGNIIDKPALVLREKLFPAR